MSVPRLLLWCTIFATAFGVIEGAQVWSRRATGPSGFRQIVVCDGTRQGAFAVAACSARIEGERGFPQALEETPPLEHRSPGAPQSPLQRFELSGKKLSFASGDFAAEIAWDALPSWQRLEHRTSGWDLLRYLPDLDAINRGISGQRIGGYLLRFRPDVLELNPRAAVIEFSSYNFRPENTIKEILRIIFEVGDIEPPRHVIAHVRDDHAPLELIQVCA